MFKVKNYARDHKFSFRTAEIVARYERRFPGVIAYNDYNDAEDCMAIFRVYD